MLPLESLEKEGGFAPTGSIRRVKERNLKIIKPKIFLRVPFRPDLTKLRKNSDSQLMKCKEYDKLT